MLMKNSRNVLELVFGVVLGPIQRESRDDIYVSRPGELWVSPRVLVMGIASSVEDEVSLHGKECVSSFSITVSGVGSGWFGSCMTSSSCRETFVLSGVPPLPVLVPCPRILRGRGDGSSALLLCTVALKCVVIIVFWSAIVCAMI